MATQRRSAGQSFKELVRNVVYRTPVEGEWLICSFPRYISPNALYGILEREILSRKSECTGCLQLLVSWIRLRGRSDFPRGSKRLIRLLSLLHTLSSDPNAKALVYCLNDVKLALLAVVAKRLSPPRPQPASTASAALFSFPTAMIAAQLARVDHAAFAAIPLEDFLEKRWENQGRRCKLRELTKRSNNLSDWIASYVLVQQSVALQTRAAEGFLEIAHHCMELGDYFAVASIIAGFAQWSMSRLTRLWPIRQKHKVIHQRMNSMMSGDKNYATYRNLLTEHVQTRKPCVPQVALFLRDLTFIEDGNTDYNVDGSPNEKKLHMIAKLITQIHQLQHAPYEDISAKIDPSLQRRLEVLPRKNLEWLEQRSKELRPMAASAEAEPSPRSDMEQSEDSTMPLEDINDQDLSSSSSQQGTISRVGLSPVPSKS